MAQPGPTNSIIDIAGIRIGCASDASIRTGVTVLTCARQSKAGVFIGGGGPGTRETHVLDPRNLVGGLDAIVLSGGSVYGLGAADAVTSLLGAKRVGYQLAGEPGVPSAPIVCGAILYDLANRGDKNWSENPPYVRLGQLAFAACEAGAGSADLLGNVGAGYGARAGALKGGQGVASIVTQDNIKVGALAVVNSFGSVLAPLPDKKSVIGKAHNPRFWAGAYEKGDEFGGLGAPLGAFDPDDWGAAKFNPLAPQSARNADGASGRDNTSLAVIATNVDLTTSECHRVAMMAQAGFARAIRPVFAPFDGDVVFAISSPSRMDELTHLPDANDAARPLWIARIGTLAADVLTRAIARGVYAAQSLDPWPNWRDWRG